MHATARGRTARRVTLVTGALVSVMTCVFMSTIIPGSMTAHAAAKPSSQASSAVTASNNGVSVTASQTENLHSHQIVTLNWSGATPTHNYSVTASPGTKNYSEFPVIIMECWGTDSGGLDTTKGAMDPAHCFGSTSPQVGTKMYSDTNDPDHPNPPATTNVINKALGFTSVTGQHYTMVGLTTTPTDLQLNAGVQPNFVYAWTGANGERQNQQFEVRTAEQYPSLGCAYGKDCTIEVVPITRPDWCADNAAAGCSGGPITPVGVAVGSLVGNGYLEAPTWWLTTNWQNRIAFPISIAPTLDVCSNGDTRAQVPVDGSELAYNAMYSWVPEFCLDPTKFNLSYVSMFEPRARDLLTTNPGTGYGANAILSSLPVTSSARPVVHAPVAVTGFAVTYLIDDKDNAQVTTLNLTPLLLAKLLTDSYRSVSTEPALQANPQDLFRDSEFLAINPGFTSTFPTNDYNMIMFGAGDQSDVIWALTSYINADPEARAWLNGTPDAYSGMTVNPKYRGMTLPELATSLLDQYVEPPESNDNDHCYREYSTPDQIVYSQPVNSMFDAAMAMVNRQSPATDICTYGQGGPPQWAKEPPQSIGSRNLLALTSVPFAEEYGLPMANLQVHQLSSGQRLFAAPTVTGMTSALAYSTEDKTTGVLSLDYQHLAANAYPGTMPVYAVVPTAGLDKTTAKDYGQFLTYAATDGQVLGDGRGQLPDGYAPLTGALSALSDYTKQVAADVTAQDGQVPTPPPNLGDTIANNLGEPSQTVQTDYGSGGLGNGTGGNTPSPTSAAPGDNGKSSTGLPQTLALTRGSNSWLASWGLPVLLAIGLLAGVLVPLIRWGGQPGHPVRLALVTFGSRIRKALPHRA